MTVARGEGSKKSKNVVNNICEWSPSESKDIDVVEMLKLARDRLHRVAIPYQGITMVIKCVISTARPIIWARL